MRSFFLPFAWFWFIGCQQFIEPKGPFEEKMVIYAILATNRNEPVQLLQCRERS
jgi:hypothetical protein